MQSSGIAYTQPGKTVGQNTSASDLTMGPRPVLQDQGLLRDIKTLTAATPKVTGRLATFLRVGCSDGITAETNNAGRAASADRTRRGRCRRCASPPRPLAQPEAQSSLDESGTESLRNVPELVSSSQGTETPAGDPPPQPAALPSVCWGGGTQQHLKKRC